MKLLTIGNVQGSYAGQLEKRIFNIVFVSEGNGTGGQEALIKKAVLYKGVKTTIMDK